jgi:diguanylate cyclase (GGDEF)-like protein
MEGLYCDARLGPKRLVTPGDVTETYNKEGLIPQIPASRLESIQSDLRQLERRDWWLWGTAIVVTLLLTTAVSLLVLNPLRHAEVPTSTPDTKSVVLGLIAIVLLFNLNSIYQQHLIKRLRRALAEQMVTMTRLEAQAREFEVLAVLDPLTGLFNRRLIEERLSGEVTRSKRHGHPLAILAFDLNDFKQINDRYGHPAGDTVLKEFASRLKRAIRSSDVAARIGGDEFLALLPECAPGQVERVLSRLTSLEVQHDGQRIQFTCSSGWTDYVSGESLEQLVERADERLYFNKRDRKISAHATHGPMLAGT